MGRLDEAAKRKVVELRKAGLSFRKIKAVLELENIKVSAQAIYLFLREFQGRLPGRVRPEESATSSPNTAPTLTQALTTARAGGTVREGWSNVQLQNLLREASHHAGLAAAAEFTKQSATVPESVAKPSGSGESSGASRPQQQNEANKDENDIQIVSVTSLARNSQQRALQSTAVGAGGPGLTAVTASAALMRRRVTPSPATNPILAARKRLLDKALSHRTKQSFQQVASLLRRDQSNIPGADLRNATYDLTTEKTTIEEQPGASGGPRRFLAQRLGPSVRSPLPAPRIGIRLPNRTSSPQTSQGPGSPVLIRLQAPSGGQCSTRRDGNPSPQQAAQETGGRGVSGAIVYGLQDQIQALGSEVRSLGLALKMLVEQQCRVEREQAQQTQVQKQILGALQGLASKLGPCCHGQKHNKTPSPPSLANTSMSTSLAQDTYNYSQGTYTQCSQAQPSYNPIDSLETVGSFKMPGLSSASMNGFPSCNNPVSLPLSHAPTQTQPYATAYTQQHSQTLMPPYTQSYASTYTQSHSQPFMGSENKTSDYSSSGRQDCNVSTQPVLNSNHSPQDHQLNIIKVE